MTAKALVCNLSFFFFHYLPVSDGMQCSLQQYTFHHYHSKSEMLKSYTWGLCFVAAVTYTVFSDKQMAFYPAALCLFTNPGQKKLYKTVNQLLFQMTLEDIAVEIQSSLRGQWKNREWERDSARLYSREQKIKVQEGGDRKAEQWAGSVLRGRFLRATGQTGSPIETHFGYVALCGGTWAWVHSSSSQRRSNYNKDIPLIRIILLLKLSECVFFSYTFVFFLDTWQ